MSADFFLLLLLLFMRLISNQNSEKRRGTPFLHGKNKYNKVFLIEFIVFTSMPNQWTRWNPMSLSSSPIPKSRSPVSERDGVNTNIRAEALVDCELSSAAMAGAPSTELLINTRRCQAVSLWLQASSGADYWGRLFVTQVNTLDNGSIVHCAPGRTSESPASLAACATFFDVL